MVAKASKAKSSWPRKVQLGRVSVPVYQRKTPSGGIAYLVANYATGRRKFDCYPNECEALEAARLLARQMSEGKVMVANMSNEDSAAFAAATQSLRPFGVSLVSAADALAKCLTLVPDLTSLVDAAKFYAARNRKITRKSVVNAVDELIELKSTRGSSFRYIQDLRARLGKFANNFQNDTCDITTPQIQSWLDNLKCAPQTIKNYGTVLNLFFEFAVARGYAVENPIAGLESIKVRGGDVQIYTPQELRLLLKAADQKFLPCLALGALAGLRSAEIERLHWEHIHLNERHIVIGKDQAKTASRRVVPMQEALYSWLAPYRDHSGRIWNGTHEDFYQAQQTTAKAAGIRWKQNALRHSYASYRFALTNDAGRVAGELGNSAGIVHRHYRELVTRGDATKWFEFGSDEDDSPAVEKPTHS